MEHMCHQLQKTKMLRVKQRNDGNVPGLQVTIKCGKHENILCKCYSSKNMHTSLTIFLKQKTRHGMDVPSPQWRQARW